MSSSWLRTILLSSPAASGQRKRQALKALAHIRRAGGEIDPDGGADAKQDQACSSTDNSCRSVVASKPRFTSIRWSPERRTMSPPPVLAGVLIRSLHTRLPTDRLPSDSGAVDAFLLLAPEPLSHFIRTALPKKDAVTLTLTCGPITSKLARNQRRPEQVQ
jgi:hypothetical protein